MAMDPSQLYAQLGQLINEQPPSLGGPEPLSVGDYRWVGRASELVIETFGDLSMEKIGFTSCAENLNGPLRGQNAQRMTVILHRAFARVEAKAPAGIQGAFIPVGAAFDAYQAVGKVLGNARRDVMIVDPYLGATTIGEFAVLAPEGITVRVLSDSFSTKADVLRPGMERWNAQLQNRPLECRLTAPRQLHDRLLIVDQEHAWILTQSLKDFAGRSPATIARANPEQAALKCAAYEGIWAEAAPITM